MLYNFLRLMCLYSNIPENLTFPKKNIPRLFVITSISLNQRRTLNNIAGNISNKFLQMYSQEQDDVIFSKMMKTMFPLVSSFIFRKDVETMV